MKSNAVVLIVALVGLLAGALAQNSSGTPEQNKRVVAQFIAAINAQDFNALDALVATDYQQNNGLPSGLIALKTQILPANYAAFAGFEIAVNDLIAEGDRVVGRVTVRGTQRADYFGTPSQGRHFESGVIHIWRLKAGKIAENWNETDRLSFPQQLGALPSTPR
jgi:steroid delta-isomerase-like uncharacterized protein